MKSMNKTLANLCSLKEAILQHRDFTKELEMCYSDFLDSFDAVSATIFINLLEMLPLETKRVEEILKVFDFVRFPVKKSVHITPM